jgi:alpha-D-ribose 1-methylphosphonate 5-triphosphate synthase subunit PhnH
MTSSFGGGFIDGPSESARAFRAILNAMARPGTVEQLAGVIGPAPLSVASAAVLLTLTDRTTPVFLAPSHDTADVRAWIGFHTGAPLAPATEAAFALGTWDSLQPLDRFPIGRPDYPDRSVTLIIDAPTDWLEFVLSGPGIEATSTVRLPEADVFRRNRTLFPLGFDALFCADTALWALPRSTRVENV